MTTLVKSSLDLVPCLVAAVKADIEANRINRLADCAASPLSDLLQKYGRFSSYQTAAMVKMTEDKVREKMKAKINRVHDKRIAEKLAEIQSVMDSGEFSAFTINVAWKKSRVWGANPSASCYGSGGAVDFGPVSGWGYDKLSTAVAGALNQCAPFLRRLYLVWEENLNSVAPKSLHDFFGYGSGYGVLPRLEGGVGVDCYPRICEVAGMKFERVASGKMFDGFKVSRNS